MFFKLSDLLAVLKALLLHLFSKVSYHYELLKKWLLKKWKQWQTLFSWAPNSPRTVTAAMKLKDACFLEGKLLQTYCKVETSLCRQKTI